MSKNNNNSCYKIVSGQFYTHKGNGIYERSFDFENNVNEHIINGWQILGDSFPEQGLMHQQMMRYPLDAAIHDRHARKRKCKQDGQ